MKPEFADNQELTLYDALRTHFQWLKQAYRQPLVLSIATGYFNPGGFALLADEFEHMEHIRLLLGAEPIPPAASRVRMPGEPRGTYFEQLHLKESLDQNFGALKRDRDLLPFSYETHLHLKRLIQFLLSGKIEVRRYEKAFLHGKAFIFGDDEGFLSGSSNFTAAGLTTNLELNLGRYDPSPVKRVHQWFKDLWNDATPYDLASIYAERFEEFDP